MTPSGVASKFSIARSTRSAIKKFSGPKIEAFLLCRLLVVDPLLK